MPGCATPECAGSPPGHAVGGWRSCGRGDKGGPGHPGNCGVHQSSESVTQEILILLYSFL